MLYLRTPADEHLRRLDPIILNFDDWQQFTRCRPLRIGHPVYFVLSVASYGVLVVAMITANFELIGKVILPPLIIKYKIQFRISKLETNFKLESPKSKYRNPKQYQNSNDQNSKLFSQSVLNICISVIVICFEFRISCFGILFYCFVFRILCFQPFAPLLHQWHSTREVVFYDRPDLILDLQVARDLFRGQYHV